MKITDQNIDEILDSNEVVVIDFWADWCAPCRMLGPVIDELSKTNSDIIIGKLDITANPITQSKFSVTSIPTIIYFKGGKEVNRTRGVVPKTSLQSMINFLKN